MRSQSDRLPKRSFPALTTKLRIPAARRARVPRLRLAGRLAVSLERRLTLVSAPAGFGKTSLACEWLASLPRKVPRAWLSLDEQDNAPARFVKYLILALESIEPSIGEQAEGLLQSVPLPSVQMIMEVLIERLAELGTHSILLLDDYHLLKEQTIHDGMAFLIDRLPIHLHLVLLSRHDPPFPLARLRANGDLLELRAEDLRFNREEATEFLNQTMGLGLSAEDVGTLHTHTEGWIAGLILAGLSMQSHSDRRRIIEGFSGTDRHVSDYLVEEVLQRQPESTQSFLLQTSILEQLNGALCDAVANRTGSQKLLEGLEQDNLFTLALDEHRHWYRYHSLFRDMLLDRLQRSFATSGLNALHERASGWYEQNGLIEPALDHALAARDFDRAAGLIEQNTLAIVQEQVMLAQLGRWLEQIPRDILSSRPSLHLLYAYTLYVNGQSNAAHRHLTEIEQIAENPALPSEAREMLLGGVQGIRVYLASDRQAPDGIIESCRQALPHLENDPNTRGMVLVLQGTAHYLQGELTDAHEVLDSAIQMSRSVGNSLNALSALGILARVELAQGRLHEAESHFHEAEQLAEGASIRSFPTLGIAYIAMGDVLCEWNDLGAAERKLVKGIELIKPLAESRWSHFLVEGYLGLVRVKLARGDKEGAEIALDRAKSLPVPALSSHLKSSEVRLWLAAGKLEPAIRWARKEPPSGESNSAEVEQLTRERVRILLGSMEARRPMSTKRELDQALGRLDRLLASAQATGQVGRVIEIMVLQALAYQAVRKLAHAKACMERALALAEPEGHIRLFADVGEPLRPLLQYGLTLGFPPRYVRALKAALVSGNSDPAEFLTRREREIARLIAAGLSNEEIASALVISGGTVKRHINNLYAKLGVSNRAQAILKVQSLGMG